MPTALMISMEIETALKHISSPIQAFAGVYIEPSREDQWKSQLLDMLVDGLAKALAGFYERRIFATMS